MRKQSQAPPCVARRERTRLCFCVGVVRRASFATGNFGESWKENRPCARGEKALASEMLCWFSLVFRLILRMMSCVCCPPLLGAAVSSIDQSIPFPPEQHSGLCGQGSPEASVIVRTSRLFRMPPVWAWFVPAFPVLARK